jgi:hypothetical protein
MDPYAHASLLAPKFTKEEYAIYETAVRHLDSYLATAEVIREWNIITFPAVLQRCMRCGAGVTRYARLV